MAVSVNTVAPLFLFRNHTNNSGFGLSMERRHCMAAVKAPRCRTVIFVPFPAQGHVTPMLRLARTLVDDDGGDDDVSITVAVPDFIHRRMGQLSIPGVALASIPSGVEDDGDGEPPGPPSFLHAMEHHMPAQLEGMLMAERDVVSCLVFDLLASWAIPMAAPRAAGGRLLGRDVGNLPHRGRNPGAYGQGSHFRIWYAFRDCTPKYFFLCRPFGSCVYLISSCICLFRYQSCFPFILLKQLSAISLYIVKLLNTLIRA